MEYKERGSFFCFGVAGDPQGGPRGSLRID